MKHALWLAAIIILFPCATSSYSSSSDDSANACDLLGQQALEADRFEEAKNVFEGKIRDAQKRGDQERETSCYFYRGLAAQLQARALPHTKGTDPASEIYLKDAAKWYEAILSSPGTEGVVTNLARVYSDLGLRDKSDLLFKNAIAKAEGNSKLALVRSYADLLRDQFRWEESAQQYRIILAVVPTDEATWDAFLGMLSEGIPEAFPEEVWRAVKENQVLAAQSHALLALSSRSTSPKAKLSLFSTIVFSLSLQNYSPETFATGKIGNSLRRLSSDPVVGVGAHLVLKAHENNIGEPQSYLWLAKHSAPYDHSPLKTFRNLLCALAKRVKDGKIESARKYLELADQIAPKVADTSLYVTVAAVYTAGTDRKALTKSLPRWESAITKAEARITATNLARFHLAMGEDLNTLGWASVSPDRVDSIEYQLARAMEAAERSGDSEIISMAQEKRLRILPLPGGGGGGGDGGGDRYARQRDLGDGNCVYGNGVCVDLRVEVPDLFPRLEDIRAGLTRSAVILKGCGMSRTVGWHFSQALPKGSASPDIRLARFASAPSNVCPGRQFADAILRSLSTSDGCPQPLSPRPLWVTSGAWGGVSSFYVVDALRSRLLRYGVDGRLLEVFGDTSIGGSHEESLSRVRPAPSGLPVLELGAGQLVWLDKESRPVMRRSLIERRGTKGVLRGIVDWAVLGESSILAIGNIWRVDGSWMIGLVRVPTSPSGGFKVASGWDAGDPGGILYRVGQPYIAAMNGRGYFLRLGETLSLYEVSIARKEPSLRLIRTVPGGLKAADQQALLHYQTDAKIADLYRLVEGLNVPAGIYAADGFLFLLRRLTNSHSGEISWQLEKLDPKEGSLLQTIKLPATAHHLTIIPGPTRWALIEKGAVKRFGDQEVSTVTFVPTSAIEGNGPGGQMTAGR